MGEVIAYRRLSDAMASLSRLSRSRRLDVLLAAKSGVPLRFGAFDVLTRIVDSGRIGLHELARRSGMQPAGLSRHLRSLEAAGCIERSNDPADGRASVVRATPKGRAAARRVRAALDDMMRAQLWDWDTDEVEHAAAVIERLERDLRTGSRAAGNGAAASRRTPNKLARPSGARQEKWRKWS